MLFRSLAGTQQGIISFTQQNEQEADRIGIQVLQRAGFDPQAKPNFLQKLADQSRYSSKPPEMLLTHPLPDSRLTDTRNRANQMRPHPVQSSLDYLLAKMRTLGMYSGNDIDGGYLSSDMLDAMARGNVREQAASRYGQAILFSQANKFDDARRTLQPQIGRAHV